MKPRSNIVGKTEAFAELVLATSIHCLSATIIVATDCPGLYHTLMFDKWLTLWSCPLFLTFNVISLWRVCKIAKSDSSLRRVCPSVRPSACNNSAHNGQIFIKFEVWVSFANLLRKLKFHQYWTRIRGILHENQCSFLIVSRSFLRRVRNVSDESYRENTNTRIIFNNFPHPPENRAVCEILWKNIGEGEGHRWHCDACTLHAG
jgi:hypothetical protein